MNIIILGAGPTGLGAAHSLDKLGHSNWTLFERTRYIGGLSTSFFDEHGFTWDVGGHVLFSHYPYFDTAVKAALGNCYYEHLRESYIRILNTWVPYPFQNNIRHLPPYAMEECVRGIPQNGRATIAQNYQEWMDAVFGRGIVKYFMGPYNKKVWAAPLETMSTKWVGERVNLVDVQRVRRNIAEAKDDITWGPNNKFKFPVSGGTGAIFRGIARPLETRIAMQHDLKEADLERKELVFSNGNRFCYDVLITTIPLDLFVSKCIKLPGEIGSAAHVLVHNGGLIVGLGFSGRRIDSKCWMYFPEDNCPFYRVTNFHNYSPYNVPNGDVDNYFSLMCETSYSFYKPVNKETIVEDTISGLIASGMITEKESKSIISRYLIDIPYSYPVPTLGRDAALNIIQPFLESCDVYSRGRFGAWKYEVGNMDHSFMQGVEVVDRILLGEPEMTVHGKVLNR